MKYALLVALLFSNVWIPVNALAQCEGIGRLVTAVEERLENTRDFSADFVQRERDGLNQTRVEEGHVWVSRPNRARWEYRIPEEKLFVTDGSDVFSYVPADRQVRRGRFEDTVDDRLPLMLLLGRSDLEREFEGRITRPIAEPVVPRACVLDIAPGEGDDFRSMRIEVDAETFDIVRFSLESDDGYSSEFVFRNVNSNEGLDEELFRFVPPPGVRLVEGL